VAPQRRRLPGSGAGPSPERLFCGSDEVGQGRQIVPAVTEVSARQAAQRRSPSDISHQPPSNAPQKRQAKPGPHRSRSK
jgi:hypothetical protein